VISNASLKYATYDDNGTYTFIRPSACSNY
jgi:hypothetical protein